MLDDRFRGFVKEGSVSKEPEKKENDTIPNTRGISLSDWRKEQNERPSMKKNNLYVVDKSQFTFYKTMTFIGIFGFLFLGFLFLYYLSEGAFKDEITNNLPINPTFNTNNTYQNNYDNQYNISANIPHTIYNQNNFTINVEVKNNCTQ